MRGGYLHNQVLIHPARSLAEAAGAGVSVEFPTLQPRGSIDLFIDLGAAQIAWEAELRPDRVPGDVAKAVSAKATHLFIVTPTAAVNRACAGRLAGVTVPQELRVSVRPLGPAIAALRRLLDELSSR